jgi:stress-induced morphogen
MTDDLLLQLLRASNQRKEDIEMKTEFATEKLSDRQTLQVETALAKYFSSVSVYRRPVTSVIRIRIVDKAFDGKSPEEREDAVFPHLERLPKGIRDDITFLLLATPKELKDSKAFLNLEFEEPSPALG